MKPTRGEKSLIKKMEREGAGEDYATRTMISALRHASPTPNPPTKPKYKPGGYYGEWYFGCLKCGAVYLVEEAKRFFGENRPEVKLDSFDEEASVESSEPEWKEDGKPP